MMEPDGRTPIIFIPDMASEMKAIYAALQQQILVQPSFKDLPELRVPRRTNERPWHKHTLPNRRRR